MISRRIANPQSWPASCAYAYCMASGKEQRWRLGLDLTCGGQRRRTARVARFGAEPEVSVKESHEEGDLPRRGQQPEELLELRAVVPQEAREERDRLGPQDLLVGCREQELAAAGAAIKLAYLSATCFCSHSKYFQHVSNCRQTNGSCDSYHILVAADCPSLLGGCGVVNGGGAERRGGETDAAVPAVDGGCSVLLEAAAAALISAVTIPQKLQPDCEEPACGQPNTLRSLRQLDRRVGKAQVSG